MTGWTTDGRAVVANVGKGQAREVRFCRDSSAETLREVASGGRTTLDTQNPRRPRRRPHRCVHRERGAYLLDEVRVSLRMSGHVHATRVRDRIAGEQPRNRKRAVEGSFTKPGED